MATITNKSKNSATITNKSKVAAITEQTLLIEGAYELLIDATYSLLIQASQAGTVITNKTKS